MEIELTNDTWQDVDHIDWNLHMSSVKFHLKGLLQWRREWMTSVGVGMYKRSVTTPSPLSTPLVFSKRFSYFMTEDVFQGKDVKKCERCKSSCSSIIKQRGLLSFFLAFFLFACEFLTQGNLARSRRIGVVENL